MFTWIKNRFVKKTAKSVRQNTTTLSLEALEDRWCPSSTTWIPHVGGGDWSNPSNWSNGVPQAGDTAVFDANKSYYNCVVDENTANVNVEITNGYNSGITVNAGCTWNINNFSDAYPGYEDSFNVQYQTSGSSGGSINISGTAQFYNISISDSAPGANEMGKTTIASTGSVILGDGWINSSSPYSIKIADEVDVEGYLSVGDYTGNDGFSEVFFDDAGGKNLVVSGTTDIKADNFGGVVQSNNGAGTYIDVRPGGTLNLKYESIFAPNNNISIDMPIHSAGTFNVTQQTWYITQKDSNGYSIYITGISWFNLGKTASASIYTSGKFGMGVDGSFSTLEVFNDSTIAPEAGDSTEMDFQSGKLKVDPGITLTLGGDIYFGYGGAYELFTLEVTYPTASTIYHPINVYNTFTQFNIDSTGSGTSDYVTKLQVDSVGGSPASGTIFTVISGIRSQIYGDFATLVLPSGYIEVSASSPRQNWQFQRE